MEASPRSNVKKSLPPGVEAAIFQSEGFHQFIESSSRIIERTLGQNNSFIDVLKDYKMDLKGGRKGLETQVLTMDTIFEDDSVRSRPVMDLQCSPHFSELFLAAYGAKSTGVRGAKKMSNSDGETPGMVAIWSSVVSIYISLKVVIKVLQRGRRVVKFLVSMFQFYSSQF